MKSADLPIFSIREALKDACSRVRRIVLQAPTGSGKSTQIPQMILDGGLVPADSQIVVLQPRRLPTRMLAARIAHERGQKLGDEVGYQIRFDRVESESTRIKFVTEGLLLRQMMSDPTLKGVGALVFDEFHERNINSDLALAMARRIQETTRPDLLLVVMSATLDTESLTGWLQPCETLSVEGRLFPIEIEYAGRAGDRPWDDVAAAFRKAYKAEPSGDFLVFMPGGYEITKTIAAIAGTPEGRECVVLPLHGELPPAEQDRAVEPDPDGRRKVVVATNVAETSLTIDGVRVVIDAGLARVARWDAHRGFNTLLIEPISRASADQRAGRAGRTAPGRCIRLWSRSDHDAKPARELAEIRRVELAETILLLKAGGAGDLDEFPWFEKPEAKSLARATELLADLGALDVSGNLTPTGRRMAQFPLHPRYSRMMMAAHERGCVSAVALIAALTQGRDIMLRLNDRRADEEREQLLGDTDSDFFHRLTLLGIARKQNFDFGVCSRYGIHAQGARQADKLAEQFMRIARAQGLDTTVRPVDSDAVRLCLLTGFSDHLAIRLDRGTLRCALVHGRKGELRRESAVRHAKLLVAAEVDEIETRGDVTVYLSLCTEVEEEWLRELFPDDFSEKKLVRYDSHMRRCVTRIERRFRDLVLDAKEREDVKSDEAGAILAAEVLAGRLELEKWNDKVDAWINKVNFAAKHLPELEIAPIDEDARKLIIEDLCAGSYAHHQIRDRDVWPSLRAWLTREQLSAIDSMMPERVSLPYKQRSAAIEYTADGEAVIAATVQELYDTPGSHFRILNGKVPLVIEIQSPGRKTQQRTRDLDAFWKGSYEAVKKDLRGRYPRQEWR